MPHTFTINVQSGNEVRAISQEELDGYAHYVGLNRIAPHRYSALFVMDLLLNDQINGVDPSSVLEEIRAMETSNNPTGTKPASPFKYEPLRGLWKKHYFSAHFVARNIQNHFSGGKLDKLIREVFDATKSPMVTREMIEELAHRYANEPLDQRAETQKLTGEWIVFAKHGGQNYYLCLATHDSKDQATFDRISMVSFREFPFLAAHLAPPQA